jgi:hypothetical protein
MAQEQETARAAELQKKTEARGRRAAKDGEKKIQIEFSGALSSKNKADLMDITQALQLSTAGTNQRISKGPPLPPRKYVYLLRLMGLADAGLLQSTYALERHFDSPLLIAKVAYTHVWCRIIQPRHVWPCDVLWYVSPHNTEFHNDCTQKLCNS